MNRNDLPRVVLCSVGFYGQKYLEALVQEPAQAAMVGVVDPAKGLTDRFPVLLERGIPVYPSLDGFLAADSADLAVLASPIHLHTEMVLKCLRHGLHVLCEKPLCLTREETILMQDAAKKADRFLSLGWQLNYDEAVLSIKRDILNGSFGTPLRFSCIHGMRRGNAYYSRSNWAGRIMVDGHEVFDSPFMNACAHNYQLMTFWLGREMDTAADIAEVKGFTYRANPNIENYDIAFLRTVSDESVPVYYYTAHPIATKNLGQLGKAEFTLGTLTWGKGKPYVFTFKNGNSRVYGMDGGTPLMRKLDVAIRCVKTGERPSCSAVAGLGHLSAVRLSQQLRVGEVAPEAVNWIHENGDDFPAVNGLEEIMTDCFENWKLPENASVIFGY